MSPFSLMAAWQPEAAPAGTVPLAGTLTISGVSQLPVTVDWGDGTTETITEDTLLEG